MGLFGDLDVASAEDNPWAVPANTYEANVFSVEVKETQDKKKRGLAITYKISSGEHEGKQVSEWKEIPQPADPKNPTPDEKKATSYLKMRLASLGVPESRMNTVDVNDLQGTPVVITVKVNGEYTNVSRVEVREGSSEAPQSFAGFGA